MGSPCPWVRKESCLANAWMQISSYYFLWSEEESVLPRTHHLSLITVAASTKKTAHVDVRVLGDEVICVMDRKSSNEPSVSNAKLR